MLAGLDSLSFSHDYPTLQTNANYINKQVMQYKGITTWVLIITTVLACTECTCTRMHECLFLIGFAKYLNTVISHKDFFFFFCMFLKI